MLPKIVFTDIDGVWTDGGMYYDQTGNELKKFNTSDSAGITLLRLVNIPVCIITGEDTKITGFRAEKLKIEYVLQGVRNKLKAADELVTRLGFHLSQAAFIGDDINDIPLFKSVGLSAAPMSSPDYVRKHAKIIIQRNGGDGAFRLFAEKILAENDLLDECIEKLIRQHLI